MHCLSKLPLALLVTCLAKTAWALPALQTPLHAGLLGEGTPFETPWFDSKGPEEGPTILIIGGMHGNEPAGAAAAEAIACWTVQHGRLVVAPRMNPPALAAQKRLIPGLAEPEGNLNRHFPTRNLRARSALIESKGCVREGASEQGGGLAGSADGDRG